MTALANSQSGISPTEFLEYHYYRGGLRTEFISVDNFRPTWAPPADWVGFRNEVALQGGDLVMEVVRFRHPDGLAAWIGLYRHSPDQIYGDRQNHAGVGVWLFNQFPSSPEFLFSGLEKLLGLLQGGIEEAFVEKSREFLRDYLNGYISKIAALPTPLEGLKAAESQVCSTVNLRIVRRASNFSAVLTDLVLRAFLMSPVSDNVHRLVVLLSISEDGNLGSLPEEYTRDRFLLDFISRVPVAFEGLQKLAGELGNRAGQLSAEAEALKRSLANVQSSLTSEQHRSVAFEKRYGELKSSLEEDDDRKRFSILNGHLTELSITTSELGKEIGQLRVSLGLQMRNEIRAAITGGRNELNVQLSNQDSQIRQQNFEVGFRPAQKIPAMRIDWTFIAFISIIVLIVVLLAVVLLSRSGVLVF